MPIQTAARPDPAEATVQRPWLWLPDAHHRNVFVLFRREIECDGAVEEATLRIAADARYRLRVNGVTVACGPVRFVPEYPCEDVHDLTPWLRTCSNAIVVEVWNPGCSTFQTMPESRGGFAPAGRVIAGDEHDLATGWHCRIGEAWDREAPAFSFAQGPVEICDTRSVPEAWFAPGDAGAGWQAVQEVAEGPWGAIAERPLPDLARTVDAPGTLTLAATLAADERRIGGRVFVDDDVRRSKVKQRFPYALWIHSPAAQTVTIGLFWGPHWLNGEAVKPTGDPLLGNRENADLALREGWNLLYGEPQALAQSWSMIVAWPVAAGLRVAAAPADGAPEAIRCGEPGPDEAMPSTTHAVPTDAASLDALPVRWSETATDPTGATTLPSRDCAWDRPGEVLQRDAAADFPLELPAASVVVYDFHREFLGTVTVEIEAPEGTVLDIANDERLREDGLLGLYRTNPFTDTADRFVCRGGRQVIEGFHPRGGRWIQLAVRPPTDGATVTLHRVAVTSAQVPVVRDGRFESSEPVFDWTFETGLATLRACVEDAFLDCPWRERGTYLGDALVEGAALASVTRDQGVTRRSLELWAQGQLPDGQMQACVPSWHRRPHEDFSLWWIPATRDYWALTGDLGFVREYRAVIDRIFASPTWDEQDASLWTAEDLHVFVDWGATATSTKGRGNGCLNAIRVLARQAAAELCDALGEEAAAEEHRAEARRVAADLDRLLWVEQEGRYAARLDDAGAPDVAEAARHANALLLLSDVVPEDRREATWTWLEAQLATNLQDGFDWGQRKGHCELYFLYYVLRACYQADRVALAERLMRQHWALPMRHGAWTIWEAFNRGVRGTGSFCHAWSCGPLAFYREQVLGVRWPAGDPSRIVVAPNSHLTWARGEVPHPQGTVSVHWQRNGGVVFLRVSAPDGIAVETRLGPTLADHQLVVED